MYLLYLDESGSSRIDNPNIREQSDFFVLGGLIIKEEDYFNQSRIFKEFKESLFPKELKTTPANAVELNHISRNNRNRYKGYLTDQQGKEIMLKLYEFIAKMPIEPIIIVIDNHNLRKKYKHPANPYLLAYEFVLEKFQKIIKGRGDNKNSLGIVNLCDSSTKLASNIKRVHRDVMKNGTTYVKDFSNILADLNIEPMSKSSFYEIADLICYAFQRSYYCFLCSNLKKQCYNEGYLKILKPICTLEIGSVVIDGSVKVKVFPEPRF